MQIRAIKKRNTKLATIKGNIYKLLGANKCKEK